MTATINNGSAHQTRRQLTDSIAKMDSLIEGLSEAIPGTIKDVLEQQVGTAIADGIKAAVLEVLRNPELMGVLRGAMPQQEQPTSRQGPQGPIIVPMPRPSLLKSMMSATRSAVSGTAGWCKEKVITAGNAIAETANAIATKLTAVRQRLWILRRLPKSLVLAVGFGSLAAAVAFCAPNGLIVSLGATVLAGVARVGIWIRRRFNAITLASD